jgi:ketosteroid isomerase-like protein
MSEENVEVVRRAVQAFNDRDIAELADLITEDYEFTPYLPAAVEKTTTMYRGRQGLRDYMKDAGEAWQSIQIHLDEVRDLGDRALAFGEMRARARGSGIDARVPLAWVLEFRDGKVSRYQSFGDTPEAREAAGLSK